MRSFDITIPEGLLRECLVAIVLIAVAAFVAFALGYYLKRFLRDWAGKTGTKLDDLIVERFTLPVIGLAIVAGIAAAKEYVKIPQQISSWLDKAVMVLILAIVFVVLARFVDGIIEFSASGYIRRAEKLQRAEAAAEMDRVQRIRKSTREIAKMLIALLGVLTILSYLGLNLKAVWASLGIGGIAVALAVQEPLRNLVGRMYIYGTGIFAEGHFIEFKQWAGTVQRITTFRTYLEMFSDMTMVSIPNEQFINSAVKSYHGRTKFMYKWDLDVPYDVSPEQLQRLVAQLREIVRARPEVNLDRCWIYLERLGQSAKVIRVWFQANLPDWGTSLIYGNEVLHEIQNVFEKMVIPFAFPTQTVHLQTENPIEGPRNGGAVSVAQPEVDEHGSG